MENDSLTTSQQQNDVVSGKNYALTGKIMLCSVIVVAAAVLIISFLHTYARCHLRRRLRRRRRGNHHRRHRLSDSSSSAAAAPPPRGLDPSVLKTLPTFTYSAAAHGPMLECAVCLSDFENDEEGRVLPKCNHTFHADCIGAWFESHSNCPLCRAPVQEFVPVRESAETIVVVPEPADTEIVSDVAVPSSSSTSDVSVSVVPDGESVEDSGAEPPEPKSRIRFHSKLMHRSFNFRRTHSHT